MISAAGFFVIPAAICIVIVFGLIRGVPLFDSFISGAKDGLDSSVKLLPTLIGLITAVTMLKASGALDIFSAFIAPAAELIGIPPETVPLALLRPVSGSGSIAILGSIFESFGPDTFIGRVASVMMGSTETTFYAVAVYYGSVGIKKTRHTIPAAVIADIATVIISALAVRIIFSL